MKRRLNVFSVRYELGFYIPENGIRHGHRHENLKLYMVFLFHSSPFIAIMAPEEGRTEAAQNHYQPVTNSK
jgi:hypothetical protein